MKPIITTIVFDLGKVIVDFSWEKSIKLIKKKLKNPDTFDFKTLVNHTALHQYERNEISTQTYAATMCSVLNNEVTTQEFIDGFNAIFTGIYPNTNTMLDALKGRYKLVALSNINDEHYNYCWEHYGETLKKFDLIIASHEVQMRKPEPRIYTFLLNELQVEANEIVYLDDLKDNIDAGVAAGLHTIWVQDALMIEEQLQAFI